MVISLREVLDIVIMSAGVGYIFMIFLRRPGYHGVYKKKFDWPAFKLAIYVTAPALILHELAHKFVAMAYGIQATFHAAYTFLLLGVVLRLLQAPFIFFIPAYVSIPANNITPFQSAMVAGAGPFMNLGIFLVAFFMLKYRKKKMKKSEFMVWNLTKFINIFLFVFNMLPFGPFDGAKFFSGLIHTFF